MNFLKISNTGHLDVEALTLLGASSKREDSTKIGMFGSGNKYALAYLLRNNYEIAIYSGTSEIVIGKSNKAFRERNFEVITVNGTETSITTDFGKDWQLWQAIRELYCNAMDEGGHCLEYVQHPTPTDGETHFYIRSRAEITNFVGSFDSYFSENRKVLFENEYGKILGKKDKSTLNLYRKGIRCFETDKESIFDYDLANISIDENRLVSYPWMVPSTIWNLIYQCTDKSVIRQVLLNVSDGDLIERTSVDYAGAHAHYMSDAYKEVLSELSLAPAGMAGLLSVEEMQSTTIVPTHIFKQAQGVVTNNNLASKFRVYKTHFYVEIDKDALHEATLQKAFDFFRECNYDKVLDYPIAIARFNDKDFLGFADIKEQKIVLSEICLAKGVQMVIETIIEEWIHLKYDVRDETRGFQNAAITEIVNLLKVKNAYCV